MMILPLKDSIIMWAPPVTTSLVLLVILTHHLMENQASKVHWLSFHSPTSTFVGWRGSVEGGGRKRRLIAPVATVV